MPACFLGMPDCLRCTEYTVACSFKTGQSKTMKKMLYACLRVRINRQPACLFISVPVGSVAGWTCPTDRRAWSRSTPSSDSEISCSTSPPSFPTLRGTCSRYFTFLLVDGTAPPLVKHRYCNFVSESDVRLWHGPCQWILPKVTIKMKAGLCITLLNNNHAMLWWLNAMHLKCNKLHSRPSTVYWQYLISFSASTAPEEKTHREWHCGGHLPGRCHSVRPGHDRL